MQQKVTEIELVEATLRAMIETDGNILSTNKKCLTFIHIYSQLLKVNQNYNLTMLGTTWIDTMQHILKKHENKDFITINKDEEWLVYIVKYETLLKFKNIIYDFYCPSL